MKINGYRLVFPALLLVAVLMAGMPSGALAQCGGGSGYMHDQHMGGYGHMGYGQYGQPAVPVDPNAVAPGYVAPAPPAYDNYNAPQNNGDYNSGQMMNHEGMGMGSGHSNHMQH